MSLPDGYVVEEYQEVLPQLQPPSWPYTITFTRMSWRCKAPDGSLVYSGAYEDNCRQQAQAILESRNQ